MSGGRRTDGIEHQAAEAIRDLVRANVDGGRLPRTAVLVVQTEDPDGGDQRTHTLFPLGEPDQPTALAMLRRALDDTRR